jgi:peptide/nickel transport system ATP-binding protein
VSIQAQILNLLKDLRDTFGLTMLFISHNLAVVRQMSDRVAVLKDGRLVELAPNETFFADAQDAYSKELLSQTPSLELLGPPRKIKVRKRPGGARP